MTLEEKMENIVRRLGYGGWRIEHGFVGIVVLTDYEAMQLIKKLEAK